jgi:hypothetical protein
MKVKGIVDKEYFGLLWSWRLSRTCFPELIFFVVVVGMGV